MTRLLALLLLLPLSGCSHPLLDVACTTEARAGLSLEVRDARDGVSLPAETEVVASGEGYAETLMGPSPARSPQALLFFGLFERAGSYRVTVQSPGYQPWVREGVRIAKEECHVRPVRLEAALVPRADAPG